MVWQDLCEVLTHPASLTQALERAQAGHWLPQELQARREQLRHGRENLTAQLERVTEAYLQGAIPFTECRQRRRERDQRLQALEQQERERNAQATQRQELARQIASVEAFCQRVQATLVQATFEQKRQLVELLIDRVVVTNGDVEIRYVIPTSPASEQVRFCHLHTDYFDRVASHIRLPNLGEIGRNRAPPPKPERHRRLGGPGQMLDLEAQERAAHQRPGVWLGAGAATRMLLRDGVQAAPRLQLDVAVLGVVS